MLYALHYPFPPWSLLEQQIGTSDCEENFQALAVKSRVDGKGLVAINSPLVDGSNSLACGACAETNVLELVKRRSMHIIPFQDDFNIGKIL
jgi:hypothetical protein